MSDAMSNGTNGARSAEQTRVFRMPSDDATAPDLMKSVPISRPVLTIIKGPQSGNTFELCDSVTSIGRDPANEIFLNDMTVSRMHATIEQENGCYVIRDANSFNGVWVNNDSVEARALRPGDFIQIGTFCMQYEEN